MVYSIAFRICEDHETIDAPSFPIPSPRRVSEKIINGTSLPKPYSSYPFYPTQCEVGPRGGLDWKEQGPDLSRSPTLVEAGRGSETKYEELLKIPIRRKHFLTDTTILMHQFTDTMVVFQHYLIQPLRSFRDRYTFWPSMEQYRSEFQIVHLHVDPNISSSDMYTMSIEEPALGKWAVPVIFPVRTGVWELVVRKLALGEVRKALVFDEQVSYKLEEPEGLPKGIVARVAQIYSRVPLIERSVARIYLALLQNYPRHHVMKDVAESFAIQRPASAIADGMVCLFGSYPET